MNTFLEDLEKLEKEFPEHFENKVNSKLRNYFEEHSGTYIKHRLFLDEDAIKKRPLPKEIEDKLRWVISLWDTNNS